MPKLWSETIEAHRREVRDSILDRTAALVAEHGLRTVTMSQIAVKTGIGRATLYKYFPDVESILLAWHERQVAGHLAHLLQVRDGAGEAGARLQAVLEAYALIQQRARGHDHDALAVFLHRGDHVTRAHQRLREMVRDLLAEGVQAGRFRDDLSADDLTAFCLHAIAAAGDVHSEESARRLAEVILAGLAP